MEQVLGIGIEQLDKQHEAFFEHMDLLQDALWRGHSRTAVQDTLRFLEDYAAVHFSAEERYMQRHAYPEFLAHRAEHGGFLRELEQFKGKLRSLESQGDFTTFLALDIVRKLNDWLENHINESDRRMGAYLAQKM